MYIHKRLAVCASVCLSTKLLMDYVNAENVIAFEVDFLRSSTCLCVW